MPYVIRSCTVRVTIFSTGGKFKLVSLFTELHTLTQAARSYALLYTLCNQRLGEVWEQGYMATV